MQRKKPSLEQPLKDIENVRWTIRQPTMNPVPSHAVMKESIHNLPQRLPYRIRNLSDTSMLPASELKHNLHSKYKQPHTSQEVSNFPIYLPLQVTPTI